MLSQRKLRFLQARSPELDTKKLFVMSVWLACVVRVMSFVGLGALQIASVQVNYSMENAVSAGDDDSVDQNQAFYDKAVIVLFDLPDYIIGELGCVCWGSLELCVYGYF